jgi:radical SAM superfamily enzyme YgiQ (UPF0313 family)
MGRPASSVLLVSCYELGHAPLGIAWPLAFLRRAGLDAETLDLSVEPFSSERAASADIVVISVPMLTALRLGVQAAQRVRAANPRAHVCFHGLYAWLNADGLLDGTADSIVAGECEDTLVNLVHAIGAGRPAAEVAGVTTRTSRAAPVRARLPFPLPDRTTLPSPSRYAGYLHDGATDTAAYVEASRGCLHLCRHCPVVPVYGGRFFVVPADVVLADIRAQVATGARHVTFGDPDFLNGPGHALDVARRLHAEWPALTFDFTAKVEHLLKHRRLLPGLAALGCTFVVSAVESLSDEVLRRLDKGHTAADVVEVLVVMDAAAIVLHPTLVAFTPWTTLDDYIATVELFRAHGLVAYVPPVQLAIRLLVPPHSALLADPDAASWVGPLDRKAFTHRWTHPDPRMDALFEGVASRVEAAEDAGEDPRQTWDAVRALAYEAAGRAVPNEAVPPAFRPDPPRLTEAWFCCAEPRRGQVDLVTSRSQQQQRDTEITENDTERTEGKRSR